MRRAVLLLIWLGSAATAETAGPPPPPLAKVSPAQAAMANYRADHMPQAAPQPCQRPKQGELVVCGQDQSADRLPLRDERGARAGERTAIGEPPHGGVGGSPVHAPPLTGITLTKTFGGKTRVAANGSP